MLKNLNFLNLKLLNKNCNSITQNKNKFLCISNLLLKNNFLNFSTTEKSKPSTETPQKTREEINEEFRMMRLQKKEEAINKHKVLKTNMYNFKSLYQVKKFYFENKELIMSSEFDINQLANLFDNHMKISKNKLKMQLPDIMSQTMTQEMIKQILRRVDELNFLSLLKILALNVSRDNKEFNENLNEFSFNLLKKFDFDKILYEKKANYWEKISTKQIVELLTSLSKMQKFSNLQYGPESATKFFNFRNKILHKIFFQADRSVLKISNYPYDELISLIYILSKIEFKHMDLFMRISEEILHPNKIKNMNVKGAVLILWTSTEMNIFNEELINNCINYLNENKNIFLEEMKKIDGMYLYNLFYFFNHNKNYLNKVDQKILDDMILIYDIINKEDLEGAEKEKISFTLDNIVLKNHVQKLHNKSLAYLNLTEALKFFFNVKKYDRVEEILYNLGQKMGYFQPNSINNYTEFFNEFLKTINNEISFDKKFILIQKMSLNLFRKILNQINETRGEINYKDYIKLSYTLFNTNLILKETIPYRNENEDLLVKEIDNFVASFVNEYTISRIFEDTYLTLESVKLFNWMNQNISKDNTLLEKIRESAEIETKFLLKRFFPKEIIFDTEDEFSEEINLPKENEDEEFDNLNLQNKKLSFNNYLNLLILITNLKLEIKNPVVEKLLQNIITPQDIEFDKNKISLTEKLIYNKLILAYYNFDQGDKNIKKTKNSLLLKITPMDLEMNLLKNKYYQNILVSSIREFKTTLFMENDKIYENHHFFDVYIPSLNLAFIIDQSSELLNLKLKNIQSEKTKENKFNKFNYLDENYKNILEKEKGISVYVIQDYMLDNMKQGEVDSKNALNYMFS
jgi:hypothetical protein